MVLDMWDKQVFIYILKSEDFNCAHDLSDRKW